MAAESLVESDIQKGQAYLNLLDQIGVRVVGAFWFYYSDNDRWRLTIVSPEADKGSRDLYRRSIEAGANIDLALVEFVTPNSAIFRALKHGITMEGTSRYRVSHSMFNGVYIDEALLYRLAA